MSDLDDGLAIEDFKSKQAVALEVRKGQLAQDIEARKAEAARDLEKFKVSAQQEIERIRSESTKQIELYKISSQEGLERAKMETSREVELLKLKKDIWVKAIDTQMHFNEMSVKSRQLGLTFVVAALALAVTMLGRQEGGRFTILWFGDYYETHVAGVIVLITAVAMFSVMLLDLLVYHRMLRGAVSFGEALERDEVRSKIMRTSRGLTETVSIYSRHADAVWSNEKRDYTYSKKKNAANKIRLFYVVSILVLICIGLALILSMAKKV